MKTLGIVLALAGVGVAGYGGYRYYKQSKGLGSLSEGSQDHNSKFAQSYWKRQAEIKEDIRRRQQLSYLNGGK